MKYLKSMSNLKDLSTEEIQEIKSTVSDMLSELDFIDINYHCDIVDFHGAYFEIRLTGENFIRIDHLEQINQVVEVVKTYLADWGYKVVIDKLYDTRGRTISFKR